MFIFSIFSKINRAIKERVVHHEPGLYLYILFPITFAFLLTFIGSRIISHYAPDVYLPWFGVHVHHFAYGFFVLAVAGYLALVFSEAKEKFLIALLHGFGLGLAFDEFGIWLHLNDSDPARWNYDGFLIFVGVVLMIITARPGAKMLKNHLPFRGRGETGGA